MTKEERLRQVGIAIEDALIAGPLGEKLFGSGSPGEDACRKAIEAMARAAIFVADTTSTS